MIDTAASGSIDSSRPGGPTISVIIPAYNTAGYIGEALDSVFAQVYTDFEIVVINDGSPDTELLEKVLDPYFGRIVYIKQENRGPSAARNAGIRCARGEHIAFLDSDDSWFPEYLSEQMKILGNSQGLDMVYSDALMYGNTPLSDKSFFQVYPPRLPVTFGNLLKGCSILPSHVVVRRQIVLEAGLFDESLHLLEDVDLWLRMIQCGGRIACNKQVLARHRYRSGSQSYVTSREMAEAQLRFMKKFEGSLNLTAGMRSALDREIKDNLTDLEIDQGKQFLLTRDFQRAINSLGKAKNNRPSTKLRLTVYGLRVAPNLTRFITIAWLRLLFAADNLGQVKPGRQK
jgi:glycosyltransferase involved in cell wall biosynthesis